MDRPVPDYEVALTGDVRGLRVGIPKEYRMDGMPAEIEALWQQGIEWFKPSGCRDQGHLACPTRAMPCRPIISIAPAEASSNLARYDGVRYGLRVEGKSLGGDV